MRGFLILSFFLSIGILSAQITFEKVITRGYDYFSSVIQTTDGGYAAMGETGYNKEDRWLARTDSVGDTLWTRVFPGRGNHRSGDRYFAETPDGGFTFLSRRSYKKATLYHVDASGDSLWEKEIFPGIAYAMTPVAGGYIIAGTDSSYGSFTVCNATYNGSVVWRRTYRFGSALPPPSICPQAIRETNDSGYMLAGYTYGAMWINVPFLMRIGPSGDSLWYRHYQIVSVDETFFSLDTTADGGFILSGGINSSYNTFILKVDNAGDTMWTYKNFDPIGAPHFNSVITTIDGGYLVCGSGRIYTYPGPDTSIVLLRKFSQGGNLEWERKIGTYGDSYGCCISHTRDNGFIIGGHVSPFVSPSENGLLIKVNANGNFTGTEGLDKSSEFKVFPNPATDQVSFTTSERNLSPLTITFYDIVGKEVCNREVHEDQSMVSFPTASWKPGMYLYMIRNSTKIITGRICVLSSRK